MPRKSKTRCIGILTSGGDCPGLNAAIRGVAKAAIGDYGMKVIGILDGFRGLAENRTIPLDDRAVSGILTLGGTILGTSRDKPHKMLMGGKTMDMTDAAVENARRLGIDCLVCLGGGGTQKNALHLHKAGGINVITLPKTIDNDVAGTDMSFGFDTAMSIATEAIDRLHTTATSHNRMIVCEVMGHGAGWLALGAGLAGGADAILIPEIPYDLSVVAEHLIERRTHGKRFSIIAVSEAARSKQEAAVRANGDEDKAREPKRGKGNDDNPCEPKRPRGKKGKSAPEPAAVPLKDDPPTQVTYVQEPMASRLARQLQHLTETEARVTSLGHVQRGGIPTASDRLLCTRLGVATAALLADGVYNVMVALRCNQCVPVPLEEVAGAKNTVPLDHAWIRAARQLGICMGDDT
ncbi:MAG: ATP-dependent 6-phosphofructokinase [Deltaproteobacteria bacterium]|nr:ATP-dependent 6-phosphofructokinase [Deltaproteobacteria bacterium]